jgi:hypothetical protein
MSEKHPSATPKNENIVEELADKFFHIIFDRIKRENVTLSETMNDLASRAIDSLQSVIKTKQLCLDDRKTLIRRFVDNFDEEELEGEEEKNETQN